MHLVKRILNRIKNRNEHNLYHNATIARKCHMLRLSDRNIYGIACRIHISLRTLHESLCIGQKLTKYCTANISAYSAPPLTDFQRWWTPAPSLLFFLISLCRHIASVSYNTVPVTCLTRCNHNRVLALSQVTRARCLPIQPCAEGGVAIDGSIHCTQNTQIINSIEPSAFKVPLTGHLRYIKLQSDSIHRIERRLG